MLLKPFFISVLPILVILYYSIRLIVSVFWYSLNVKSYLTKINSQRGSLGVFVTKYTILLIITLLFLINIVIVHDSIGLISYKLNHVTITQINVFSLFFLIILWYATLNKSILNKYSVDCVLSISILYLSCITIISSNNLLNTFFLLEILNAIILYLFLITSGFTQKNNLQQMLSLKIVTSAAYQFILNFFSSIMFYAAVNGLIFYFGTSSLFSISSLTYYNTTVWVSFCILALFIKFGSGPWMFFKISIYKNFNYTLLALYTIIYFSVILIYFMNLFLLYNLSFTPITAVILVSLTLISGVLFANSIYSYSNIFMFFSFSSLINLLFFLLQLFVVKL